MFIVCCFWESDSNFLMTHPVLVLCSSNELLSRSYMPRPLCFTIAAHEQQTWSVVIRVHFRLQVFLHTVPFQLRKMDGVYLFQRVWILCEMAVM